MVVDFGDDTGDVTRRDDDVTEGEGERGGERGFGGVAMGMSRTIRCC